MKCAERIPGIPEGRLPVAKPPGEPHDLPCKPRHREHGHEPRDEHGQEDEQIDEGHRRGGIPHAVVREAGKEEAYGSQRPQGVSDSRQEREHPAQDASRGHGSSQSRQDGGQHQNPGCARKQVEPEVEGEGEPPELSVVFPESLEEEDLFAHVGGFTHEILLSRLGPPVHLFQVGATVASLSPSRGERERAPSEDEQGDGQVSPSYHRKPPGRRPEAR